MRALTSIIAAALLAYGLGVWLTVAANPEVEFWSEVVERRDRDLEAVRAANPATRMLLFTGGSSCAFSIDPRVIEAQCGLPAVNLGLPASTGRSYILHQALVRARPGDILVVCLEPDFLAYPDQEGSPSKLGLALALKQGEVHGAAGWDTFDTRVTPGQFLSLTRPGGRYLMTLAGRTLTGKGYRYMVDGIDYHGLIRTDLVNPNPEWPGIPTSTQLDPVARQFLKAFIATATDRGVQVVYSMPWQLNHPDHAGASRAAKQALLLEISDLMPVIDDGYAGVSSNQDHFSDSLLHLSRTGVQLRTAALGQALMPLLESLEDDEKPLLDR